MLSTITVVLPIFALILVGWLTRRMGVLGPGATTELSRFVLHLGLPALLFDIVAHAEWSDIWQPAFVATYGLGSGLIFVLTIAIRLRQARHLADAAIDGLNAAYANTGFLGFPLVMVTLGPQALGPTMLGLILTVCVLFAVGIIVIETSLHAAANRFRLMLKVGASLLRNPLLLAPALGTLVTLADVTLPTPVERFVTLLSGAASPCALVALGLFLAEPRKGARRETGTIMLLVWLKLVGQPVVTWLLATFVFGLSPLLTTTAVLLAALPTGTGPFMLAELYRREAGITSSVVFVSTVLSLLTVSAYLSWVG